MADSTAEEDQSRERSRSLASLSTSRWREKLKEKASKFSKGSGKSASDEQHHNVSDFLRPSASSAADSRPSNLGLTIPSLDKSDLDGQPSVPTISFRKKRKPKGLHVSFSSKEPDIIGEGGDESETPSKDVIGSWKGPQSSPRSSTEIQGDKKPNLPASLASPTMLAPPQPRSPPAPTVGRDASTRQSFLQRAPTRRPIGGWEQRRQSMNIEEGLVQAHKNEDMEGRHISKIDAPVLDPVPLTTQPLSTTEQLSPRYPAGAVTLSAPPSQDIKPRQPSDASFIAYNPSMAKVAPPVSRSPQSLPVTNQDQSRLEPQRTTAAAGVQQQTSAPRVGLGPRKEPSPSRSRSATTAAAHPNHNGTNQDLPLYDHDGNMVGQAESEDFYSRMQHLRGVFRLAAEKSVDIENKALEHWLRVSAWWFLRGKSTLEKNARAMRQEKTSSEQQSQQCYVDLAKAWWAMEDVIPDHVGPHSAASIRNTLDTFDGLDYPHLLGVHQMLQANMNSFAIFMKKNNTLPPPALLIQGADPCIWIESPKLPPGILSLTAGLDPRTLTKRTKRAFFPIFLGDTDRYFSYGRVFGEAEIVSEEGEAEDQQFPCIISIIREKTSSQADLTIVSQDGQINLHIQSDPKYGPTWKDVEWKVKSHSIRIRLSRDFQVALRLWEEDFRILWGINDYIRRVEADWRPLENEELLFDDVVGTFHYSGPSQSSGNFPSVPVKNCPVRLFERRLFRIEGQAQRKIFDGLRLVVVTAPNTKTLSSISRTFGKAAPVLYSYLRGEGDAPALLLAIREGNEKTSLILTFRNTAQRAELHSLVSAVTTRPDENQSFEIPLEKMWVQELHTTSADSPQTSSFATTATWKSVKVIDRGPLDSSTPRTFSDRLRICSTCNMGSVVDLANLGNKEDSFLYECH